MLAVLSYTEESWLQTTRSMKAVALSGGLAKTQVKGSSCGRLEASLSAVHVPSEVPYSMRTVSPPVQPSPDVFQIMATSPFQVSPPLGESRWIVRRGLLFEASNVPPKAPMLIRSPLIAGSSLTGSSGSPASMHGLVAESARHAPLCQEFPLLRQ